MKAFPSVIITRSKGRVVLKSGSLTIIAGSVPAAFAQFTAIQESK